MAGETIEMGSLLWQVALDVRNQEDMPWDDLLPPFNHLSWRARGLVGLVDATRLGPFG